MSVFGFCRDTSMMQGVVLRALRSLKKRSKIIQGRCSKKLLELWRSYMISSGMCFTALEALVSEVDLVGLKEDMVNALKGTGFGFGAFVRPLSEEELKRVKLALERPCGRS